MQAGRLLRSRRGHGPLRIVGWFVLGLITLALVLAAVGLALINTEAGERWVHGQLVSGARETLPGLEVGDLDGFLPFELVLEDVRIEDTRGRPALEVARVDVDPNVWTLLGQGQIELEQLTFRQPRVWLVQDAEGRWNAEDLVAEREMEREVERRHLLIEDLRVTDGQLVATRPDGELARLSDLGLRGSIRATERDLAATVSELALDFRTRGVDGALRAQARAQVSDERVDGGLEAQVEAPRGAKPTPIVASLEGPREKLAVALRVGATDEPVLRVAGELGLDRPAYDLRGVVRGLDPRALRRDYPRGDIDLTFTVSGTGMPLEPGARLRAELDSAGFDVAGTSVESLDAAARAEGERWTLDRLHLTGPGFALRAQGGGTPDAYRLRASLEAPSLGPLEVAGTSVRYEGEARGTVERLARGDLDVHATATARAARWGETRVRNLTAELAGRLDPAGQTGRLTFEAARPFLVNDVRLSGMNIAARAEERALHLDARASLATETGRGLTPLRAEARLPLEPEGGFSVARREPLQAQARWSGVSMRQLARLAGLEEAIGGELALVADVEGTFDAPRIQVRIAVEGGRYSDVRNVGGVLQLSADEEDVLATLDASLRGEPILEARAHTALGGGRLLEQDDWLNVPFEVAARMRPTPAERLAALVPALEKLTARLSGELRATGTVRHPELSIIVNAVQPGAGRRDPVTAQLEVTGATRQGRTELEADLRLERAVVLRVRGEIHATPGQAIEGDPPDEPRIVGEGRIGPLPLEQVGALYGPLEPFAGSLRGEVRIRGSPANLEGEAQLQGEGLRADDEPVGNLQLAARLDRNEGRLEGTVVQPDGQGTLRALLDDQGEARVELQLRQVDVGALREAMPTTALADDTVSGQLLATGQIEARSGGRRDRVAPLERMRDPSFVRGRVEVDGARLALYLQQPAGRDVEPQDARSERLDERLREAVPFHMERLEVSDARLRLVDGTVKGEPGFDLHELAVTLENVASRRPDMNGAPAVLAFRALVEGAAEATGFATFDPLADPPLAAGHAALRTLKLSRLSEFLQPMYDVRAPEGTLSVFATFRLHGQEIAGSIKPIVADPEIEPADTASFFEKMGIEIADLATDVFSDEVAGRDAVATVIPIRGRLGDAQAQIVPAILAVIRNAFVVGLASGFVNLPLDIAAEDQSIFQQAFDALSPGRFPKAQPEE